MRTGEALFRTYFCDLNVLFFNTMESRSKEVEELPIINQLTKSSEKSLEQLLDEEEEDVLDKTYMGSLIDLIYQTWIMNTFFYQRFENDDWMYTDLYGEVAKNRPRIQYV